MGKFNRPVRGGLCLCVDYSHSNDASSSGKEFNIFAFPSLQGDGNSRFLFVSFASLHSRTHRIGDGGFEGIRTLSEIEILTVCENGRTGWVSAA